MDLQRWYWWMLPATIAFGFAWSWVLLCVIPPRCTAREWLRAWKGVPGLPVLALAAVRRRLRPR